MNVSGLKEACPSNISGSFENLASKYSTDIIVDAWQKQHVYACRRIHDWAMTVLR